MTVTADTQGVEEQRSLVALSTRLPAGGWGASTLPQAPKPPTVTGTQQGEMRSIIIQAARKMQLTGWGADGTTTGFTEVVPYRRLWIAPGYPIEYTKQEKQALAAAMLRDGQRDPIAVVKAIDPRSEDDGGEGGDLMIVDGVRRYLSAPYAGISELGVIVQPYANYYFAVSDSVARKVSQTEHVLSDLEIGHMIIWMRIAHNLTRAQDPKLPKFPTQVELAAMLGRSQGTISKWCSLAQMPDSVLERIMAGTLSQAQATELLPLPPEEQDRVAGKVAAANAEAASQGSRPVPRGQVREMAKNGGQQQARWTIPVNPVPSGLWVERLQDEQLPVAVAVLAHDLALCLEAAASNMNRYPHPAFAALRRALDAPEVRRHIQSVGIAKS